MTINKPCYKCGEIKSVGEFHKDKNTADGYNRWCKECRSVYLKARREKAKAERCAKKCARCKAVKELSGEFHYDEAYKNKYSRICKTCSPVPPREKVYLYKPNKCIDCEAPINYESKRCITCMGIHKRGRDEFFLNERRFAAGGGYNGDVDLEIYIYGLMLPNGKIFYVGQSFTPEKRFMAHRSQSNPEVIRQIDLLHSANEEPRLMILDKCDVETAPSRETYWIADLLLAGHPLLNRIIPNFRLIGFEVSDFVGA